MAMYKNVNGEKILLSQEEEDLILAEWALEAKKQAAETYKYDRIAAYPSTVDQLDMIYKDMVDGTTTWKDLITSIKSQYPKPEVAAEEPLK